MKSHKQRFGHRFQGIPIASVVREFGGDLALLVAFKLSKCKVCGRTEERMEY